MIKSRLFLLLVLNIIADGIRNWDEEEHEIVKTPPVFYPYLYDLSGTSDGKNVVEYVPSNRKDREKKNTFWAL